MHATTRRSIGATPRICYFINAYLFRSIENINYLLEYPSRVPLLFKFFERAEAREELC